MVVRVPLIALVSAGSLSDINLDDEVPETIPVARLSPNRSYLAMRVRGDSMDRVSPDGSIIIVDRDVRDPVRRKILCLLASRRGDL
jgi:phage repressor protein C with HTH and peptisase S24 domain